jgi:hypothetical protein
MANVEPYTGNADAFGSSGFENPQERKQRLEGALSALAGRLEAVAADQQSRRKNIEDRWLLDTRQYHGRYSQGVEKALANAEKSRVFVNITRAKTLAWAARLSDMLYPVDDKPWSIKPTPVPELSDDAERSVESAIESAREATQAREAGDEQAEQAALSRAETAAEHSKEAQLRLDEARRRAKLMSDEMEDQLRESQYNIRCREGITDMCRIGTEIMKGPVVGERRKRQWRRLSEAVTSVDRQPIPGENAQRAGEWELREISDPRPEFRGVNPWLFYPEMAARTIEESEYTFELHPLTVKDVKNLQNRDDFDKDALREVLKEGILGDVPHWWPQLREISDGDQSGDTKRFLFWEYHGALEEEDVRNLIQAFGGIDRDEILEEFESDPLTQLNAVLWFCQGHVCKFGLHPLDRGDSLYSVTPFERDDSMMFGYGVPAILRNPQAIKNGAWRMMMDNAALSAGVNLFINRKKVEPANNKWEITGKKLWYIKEEVAPNEKIVEQIKFDVRQAELERIAALADAAADMEVSMPLVAMGEQAGHITTGQQGLALLINSANVIFRHATRNYDDHHTTPSIRRLYDWNMQHSKREDIKGDMEIDARGSSVLLVREMQSQNLMTILRLFANDPVIGPYLKTSNGLSILVQTLSLRSDELVKTDQEVADEEAERKNNAEPPLEVMMQRELHKHQREMQMDELNAKRIITGAELESSLITLAETRNIEVEKLRGILVKAREELMSRERDSQRVAASKERMLAAEVAAQRELGGSGGGGHV